MIRQLQETDYNTWIKIAAEVEFLFGPMVQDKEFQDGITVCIEKGDAYGKINSEGIITGIVAIDRELNEITWLAVGKRYRGNNIGDELVKKAIEMMQERGDVYVQTFSETNEIGTSARKIYLNNGFIDLKSAGRNPAGIDTVVMVRKSVNKQ